MIAHTLALARRLSPACIAPLAFAGLLITIGSMHTAPAHALQADASVARSGLLTQADVITSHVYLPVIARPDACGAPTGEVYGTVAPNPIGTDPINDYLVNLSLRGYEPINETKDLITYGPPGDPSAPQFPALFADMRTPVFPNVYAVHKWDSGCNCPLPILVTSPPVTVLGMATTPGEIIHLPDSGYDIWAGYEAMVTYAGETRLALKYTPGDEVAGGYLIYLENVCPDPALLTLYRDLNAAGRAQLPALFGHQPLGRAASNEIRIAVKDQGNWQDPRSRNSWWIGP